MAFKFVAVVQGKAVDTTYEQVTEPKLAEQAVSSLG